VTEVGRFFDAVSYSEADQAEVQARMWRDGVINGVGNNLAVTIGGGFANVNTGEAFVQGFWYKNTASKAIAIPTNASATARIDLVVLALDRTGNSLISTLHVGVVGAGTPALTQIVGGNWELAIASISTASNVSTLTDIRTYQSNMFNPMTTTDDIITADSHANPIRKAKGAANSLLGVDAAGVFGYRKITPVDMVNNVGSYLMGWDVSGNPIARQLVAGNVPAGIITPGMHSNPSTHRLDYNLSGTWWSNVSAGSGTFDACNDQAFVVSVTSLCLLSTKGAIYWTNTTGGASCYVHLVLDGAVRSYLATAYEPAANAPVSLNWSQALLVPLTAGTHTMRIQMVCASAGNTLYLDPSSGGYRHLYLGAAEFP
jgi:hypothetical protein